MSYFNSNYTGIRDYFEKNKFLKYLSILFLIFIIILLIYTFSRQIAHGVLSIAIIPYRVLLKKIAFIILLILIYLSTVSIFVPYYKYNNPNNYGLSNYNIGAPLQEFLKATQYISILLFLFVFGIFFIILYNYDKNNTTLDIIFKLIKYIFDFIILFIIIIFILISWKFLNILLY